MSVPAFVCRATRDLCMVSALVTKNESYAYSFCHLLHALCSEGEGGGVCAVDLFS